VVQIQLVKLGLFVAGELKLELELELELQLQLVLSFLT
jgi:hypothetical protein